MNTKGMIRSSWQKFRDSCGTSHHPRCNVLLAHGGCVPLGGSWEKVEDRVEPALQWERVDKYVERAVWQSHPACGPCCQGYSA